MFRSQSVATGVEMWAVGDARVTSSSSVQASMSRVAAQRFALREAVAQRRTAARRDRAARRSGRVQTVPQPAPVEAAEATQLTRVG